MSKEKKTLYNLKEHFEANMISDKEFEKFVDACKGKVLNHLMVVLRDREDVEDCFQKAVIKAYEHKDEFQHRSQFSTWFWRIAHNCGIDCYRKKRREKKSTTEPSIEPQVDLSVDLEVYLEKLPKKQRDVFELVYLKNLSQKEVAEQLGIAYGTVRSRLHFAKKRLREFFK